MIKGKTVDEYILNSPTWAQPKLEEIRQIAVELGLKEDVKWGGPAYIHKTNIVGLGAFKNWVAVWFHQGVFLSDSAKKLVAAQDKTKGLRQWRFMPDEEIPVDLLKAYISEAIANDENGLKISPKKKAKQVELPDVLEEALKSKPQLWSIFQEMPYSHQREYCEYINEAKRPETKVRRVQKSIDLIAKGAGLNDKYK